MKFNNLPDCKLLCVTGKMASGKNYICSQLEKEGWSSIDADILVHKAIELAKDKILETFTSYAQKQNINIKNTDGTINRRALGQLLFSVPELMKIQESIVYPIITEMIEEFIKEHDKTIINATVLYKTPKLLHKCNKIYYVKASTIKRLIRARKRDNMSYKEILKRFYSQRKLLSNYKNAGIPIEIIKN